jgi:hypothetical protein
MSGPVLASVGGQDRRRKPSGVILNDDNAMEAGHFDQYLTPFRF